MPRTEKPAEPDTIVALGTIYPLDGQSCAYCNAPSIMRIIYADTRYMIKDSFPACGEHADRWAYRHYGKYLVLRTPPPAKKGELLCPP